MSPSAVARLLPDQGIPADAAPMFRQLGYECSHVSEFGMQKAEDVGILSFARDRGCVMITLDADFHALVQSNRLLNISTARSGFYRRLYGRIVWISPKTELS